MSATTFSTHAATAINLIRQCVAVIWSLVWISISRQRPLIIPQVLHNLIETASVGLYMYIVICPNSIEVLVLTIFLTNFMSSTNMEKSDKYISNSSIRSSVDFQGARVVGGKKDGSHRPSDTYCWI
jgi:hypothetical protein